MFKPLLAAKMPKEKDGSMISVEKAVHSFQYPLIASPKLDGIRVVIHDGEIKTRKLKLVPNDYIRNELSTPEYAGLDGEIMTASADDAQAFRKTTSGVMSKAGEPDFLYHVFDLIHSADAPFYERYQNLQRWAKGLKHVKVVKHEIIESPEDLLHYEEEQLELGYEGTMIRSMNGTYKFGRSTWREGILRKLIRLERQEAIVVGTYERMHNANEAKRDEIGRLKRSSHKENKIPRGDLGGLILSNGNFTDEFDVGTGFTDAERAKLWKIRDKLIGKTVTFEHRPYGNYDKPRFPTFVGFRDNKDM